MLPNLNNIGKEFFKLEKIGNTDLAQDVIDYDGEDTFLLDCYTLDHVDGEYICRSRDQLGNVKLVEINACAVIGEYGGGVRCYERNIQAYEDVDGEMWMDAEFHDEVFC